jgi:hypothetical protein
MDLSIDLMARGVRIIGGDEARLRRSLHGSIQG